MRCDHGRSLVEFDYVYPNSSATFVQIDAHAYQHFIALMTMDEYWLGAALATRAGLSGYGFLSSLVSDESSQSQIVAALLAASETDLSPFVILDQRPASR